MWLRDSSAQVNPYIPFAKKDYELRKMLIGVINKQVEMILFDSYANAFNDGPVGSEWQNDYTEMKPELHERKWEIDSLCYPVRFSYNLWKSTDDSSFFDENYKQAIKKIIKTFKEQQRKENDGPYSFGRATAWSTDTVPGNGFGNPINPIGLIVSIFRPSDDATIFPFLIPSNLFAVKSLRQLSEICIEIYNDSKLANECIQLADEVDNALKIYSSFEHLNFGRILAYEVDGFGNKLFMDDANIPSLLSLPYLGIINLDDELYQNTRKFILSASNPYYFQGAHASGIGSPHTLKNKIWPMSIIMQALTSNSDEEIRDCLRYLKNTHANTYFMHESFNIDNSKDFTRSWFAWANSLFGELIAKLYKENSKILSFEL